MSLSTQAPLGLIHSVPQSGLFTLSELKTRLVETLASKAFQSQLHDIIQYIHNETLGQSSSNGLDVMVHTGIDLPYSPGAAIMTFHPL